MPYHHEDLRGAFLSAAAAAITADGIDSLNLRALARDLDVTHAAARHHFGGRRGLLTALAVQGHHELTTALDEAPNLLQSGIAYVNFALSHPAHFQVMFAPQLVDADDPGLQAAQNALADALIRVTEESAEFGPTSPRTPGAGKPPPDDARPRPTTEPALLAAWSLAHGLATLAVSGNLPDLAEDGGQELIRDTLDRLLRSRATD